MTLANAIERAGVSRPSSYRAFQHETLTAQSNFSTKLAVRMTELSQLFDPTPLFAPVDELLAKMNTSAATSAELTRAAIESVRLLGNAYFEAGVKDPFLPTYQTILVASTDASAPPELVEAIRTAEQSAIAKFTLLYQRFFDAAGLLLREGWTWQRLGNAINESVIGIFGSHEFEDRIVLTTFTSEEPRPWSPVAIASLGHLMVATRPDPRRHTASNLIVAAAAAASHDEIQPPNHAGDA